MKSITLLLILFVPGWAFALSPAPTSKQIVDGIFGRQEKLLLDLQIANKERIEVCAVSPDVVNQQQMNMCAHAISGYYEAYLLLGLHRGALKVYDQVDQAGNYGADELFKAVARSQKNWAASMKDECFVLSQLDGGGSIANLVSAGCYTDAVKERGKRLKFLAKERGLSGLDVALVSEAAALQLKFEDMVRAAEAQTSAE